jgi:uncharacterized RDD family membrane protein YckC
VNEFEDYADWYVWAKRNLSTDAGVCHGAAAAATSALASGGDRQQAITAARQSLTSAAHLDVAAADIRRRTYAEWFDWARREVGGVREQQHAAARAALATLDAGQGANAAMAAARAAFAGEGAQPHPAAPALAPPGYQPYAPPPASAAYGPPPAVPPPPYFAGYAGFWRRFLAFWIDWVIWVVAVTLLGGILGGFIGVGIAIAGGTVDSERVANDAVGPLYVLSYVVLWLYYTICEASPWQATPGKLALGIRVSDLSGHRIGWGRANARFWSKLLSSLLLGIGFLVIAFTERKQGLHDMIAATLVVRRP